MIFQKRIYLLWLLCLVGNASAMESPVLTDDEIDFFEAVKTGDEERVLSLIKTVNINAQNWCYDTPLLVAFINDRESIAKILIEAGANGGMANMFHNTPLWYACKYKMIDVVRLLLTKKVNINAIVNTYHTHEVPILIGLISQEEIKLPFPKESEEIIKVLMENGATINTEAYFRLNRSDEELLYLLHLVKEYNINTKNTCGNTLLHTASLRAGYIEYMKFLVQKGAEVNAINDDGNSPLHFACMGGAADSVAYLLDHGADHLMINKKNKTAYESVTYAHEGDYVSERIQRLIRNKESLPTLQKKLHNNNICKGIHIRQITGK